MAKPGTESDGELTPKQIAELRALLLAKRRGLGDERRPRESEAPQRQADEMDAASDATAEAESLGLSEHNGRMRKEIDRALAKFEGGTYGVSEESGEPIGFGRLRIIPWGSPDRSRRRSARAAFALTASSRREEHVRRPGRAARADVSRR